VTAPRWEDVPEADRAVFVDVMTRMRDDLAQRARVDHGRPDIGDRSVAMFDAALARLAEPAQPTAAERWRAVPAEDRERALSVVVGARDCDSGPWDDLIHPCMVGAADGDDRPECRCRFYTRDPQSSAFRGPMRWTREDAAATLDLLGFTHSADAARFGDARRLRSTVRELLLDAREDMSLGAFSDVKGAALRLTAARILRAVRP